MSPFGNRRGAVGNILTIGGVMIAAALVLSASSSAQGAAPDVAQLVGSLGIPGAVASLVWAFAGGIVVWQKFTKAKSNGRGSELAAFERLADKMEDNLEKSQAQLADNIRSALTVAMMQNEALTRETMRSVEKLFERRRG